MYEKEHDLFLPDSKITVVSHVNGQTFKLKTRTDLMMTLGREVEEINLVAEWEPYRFRSPELRVSLAWWHTENKPLYKVIKNG